ncbi:MAG: Gfo/Idh/MocA family oxidoreductase [Kiritimatiellaeota bacterium]|nr:Gfo/Idh/MocA family oxidoreductase [Kiritimatiellota bacterium]
MSRKIRCGVLGAGRGVALAMGAKANGMEVAAMCDLDTGLLRRANERLGGQCRLYDDYGAMLRADIDAVLLANYATEHAGAAIRALAAGKHVMSECMACFTMAEAVALVEAVERSGRVYMLAENYPFIVQNIELKRLFETGKYGKFVYGEGEYVHPIPAREMATLYTGEKHWRAWLASPYYCTHSMAPIMEITGTRPVRVSGFAFPYDAGDEQMALSLRVSDPGCVLMCAMDNEAVVKLLPWTMLRDHGQRYRICCAKGTLEWNQGDGRVRVRTEAFDFPDEKEHFHYYDATLPPEFAEAARHGHGGGDYFTSLHFAEAIETGIIAPRLDVYNAVDMTVIGIQGYRSILNQSAPMEIPDFHDPAMREKYRHDHWNHDPARRAPGMPLPSVRGEIRVTEAARKLFAEERAKIEG